MRDRLAEFLRAASEEPVEWGWNDCTATPCRWLRENGHNVRMPAYASRDQAHAIIRMRGDLVATWDSALAPARIYERMGAPQLGDVAIIDTRIYGQIGGILADGGILVIRKDDGGFHWFGPVRRFLKVWAAS